MKAAAPSLAARLPVESSWVAMFAKLIKARLTSLVLLTTAVGFLIGWRGPLDYGLMVHTLLGTALLAGGASALNQLLEREQDGRMSRTWHRPLPAGRMQPGAVLAFGSGSAVLGLIQLALAVNPTTSLLGAISLTSYLFIYTPLKRVTWLNTLAGAVPGGLPPLIGWTAARGELTGGGWTLFAIQAFWQLPHFLAIAWMYREEYARAGFVMLPVVDPQGRRTGRQALTHALALLAASLCPVLLGLAGPVYLAGAVTLGIGFLWCACRFAARLSFGSARQLFCASILYLPLLLGLMVLDKR